MLLSVLNLRSLRCESHPLGEGLPVSVWPPRDGMTFAHGSVSKS